MYRLLARRVQGKGEQKKKWEEEENGETTEGENEPEKRKACPEGEHLNYERQLS